MKRAILILLAPTTFAFADASDEPGVHFFTVPSPSNKFHVVHTVRQWRAASSVSQFGRVQVFDTESGREVWRLDGVLVDEGGVFPADDGIHLVVLRRRLWGVGAEVKRHQPIILFYARERLLKSYTLDDLQIDAAKLSHSVSHSEFYLYRPMLGGWRWEWPLGTEAANIEMRYTTEPNPYWRDGAFELRTIDDQRLRFDPATGGKFSAEPK